MFCKKCLFYFSFIFCLSPPQVACMQLINALVTSPDDLDFRIHLRNEFLRCGLKKILPVSYQIIRRHIVKLFTRIRKMSVFTLSCVNQYKSVQHTILYYFFEHILTPPGRFVASKYKTLQLECVLSKCPTLIQFKIIEFLRL